MIQLNVGAFQRNAFAFPKGTWDISGTAYVSSSMEGTMRQLGFQERLSFLFLRGYYAE